MKKSEIIKKIQKYNFYVPRIKYQSKEYLLETLKRLQERK